MKYTIYIIALICLFSSCKEETIVTIELDEEEVMLTVQKHMDDQMKCWNEGDIPCYMKHYWQSDSLLFIGKKGITRGWQPTLDNYLEGYEDTIAMGHLTFDNKIIRMIDSESVQVIGRWSIERENESDNISGHYSLIWQQRNGEWVIISDHSS